jgi:N-acetylglutamate synthase-like GNAT family acetyltransferase
MSVPDTPRPGWRVRAIRRKMSFETFQRTVPVRPGWKREYYGGMARVRPSWTQVTFELDVAPCLVPETRGLRLVAPGDAAELIAAFVDSFRFAPDYSAYPMKQFRAKAAEYVKGFFGDVRGAWSPASAIVIRGGRVAAAALIKDRTPKPPLLDCLFVRPACFRRGLATVVAARAVNELATAGLMTLRSFVMLANEASIAWHTAFGFRELPNLFVAQARCYSAQYEFERLKRFGRLTDEERARLTALAERWWAEVQRLDNLPVAERYLGFDE